MRNNLLFIFLVALIFLSCENQTEPTPDFDPLPYVNPNIGAVHARWFFYTPAANPFGMAKPAPHTNAYNSIGSWLPGGYDNRHNSIEGFGPFHEFQIGGVVVMPTTGKILSVPGTLEDPDAGYRSRFDKKDELAEPGYYSVFLKDYQVKTELTSTKRVAYYRFTFPESGASNLIFDIGHKQGESSDVIHAEMKMLTDQTFEGSVETYPEYAKFCDEGNHVKMFFYGQLNMTPSATGSFVNEESTPGPRESAGVENGMYLTFETGENQVLEMQMGLSYTSTENAKLNLETESVEVSFNEAKESAQDAWREKLGRIKAESKDSLRMVKFYTGLYHATLGRGIASDVNGNYPKNDGTIGQIPLDQNGHPKYHHFNTDGMWGGFWNLSQLWGMAYPEYFKEYLQANVDLTKETGWLHDGLAAGVYTNGVQTNFFGLLLASSHHLGIDLFDDEEIIYQVAYKNETSYMNRPFGSGKYDLGYFMKQGYIHSYDTTLSNGWVFNFGASHTLEFSFSSYAVAQFAKSLGKMDDYQKLMKQANGWKNLFDSETQYLRPKYADGTFVENFDPMEPWRGFQEGNAVQYTWYVPHDPASLIDTLGVELFNNRLEKSFNESQKSLFGGGKELDSFSGLETLYNHGNQPCLFQPYLFNYSGKPWLTQKWTRTICNEFYGTDAIHGYGYGQDEDQGQLGAWFVMSSIGLLDVQGHTSANPTFQFGSPAFDRVTVQLNGGKSLVIETENNSEANMYIQSASFNGKPVHNSWIYRNELMEGGSLHFVMGPEPNKEWGVGTPPPSMSTEEEM
jgi:predicted alpha-1,2-mannosidase